jgi:hypothetical protein
MMCPGVAGPNRATGPVRIFHAILKAGLAGGSARLYHRIEA